jgi:competence protein ComEC
MTGRTATIGAWVLLASAVSCNGDPSGSNGTGTSGSGTGASMATGGDAPGTMSADGSGSSGAGETSPPTTGPGDTTIASTTEGGDDTDASTGAGVTGTLEIYWIDTEGGAATLLVTPEGPLVLVDAGNPGDRDADRIAAVVEGMLGRDTIDVVIITHYHGDHVGGVPDLVERVAVDAFWDHGDVVAPCGGSCADQWNAYLAAADGKRTTLEPGDVHEVGGLALHIVASHGALIDAPVGAGLPNPACDGAPTMPENYDENGQSVGFVARFGAFDFLDLGDLYWFEEAMLACPTDLLGPIDLYQTTHHGLDSSGAVQMVHGIEPTVVVMNNGPHKGGAPESHDTIASAPSMPDLWQVHRALDTDDAHNTEADLIANPGENAADEGHWLRATIEGPTGMITLHNPRNGVERSYASR